MTVENEKKEKYLLISDEDTEKLTYPAFAPTWDLTERQEPYKEFKFRDRGLDADPKLKNLFPSNDLESNSIKIEELTPKFGTIIHGIQLSKLSDAAKNDLALYVAQKGVVIFRDQDFASQGPDFVEQYGEYYGPLHSHPTSGAPRGHPNIHLVYKDKYTKASSGSYLKQHITTMTWHSDVSYELQPLGLTFLGILDGPTVGGDTAFADTQEAYDRLSPDFQKILEGLTAVHSGFEQAETARLGNGHVRREPVAHEHPVVRTHPVTKKKSIYVNPQFTRYIKGFKKEESDAILNFLYNFIATGVDIQTRAKWEKDTVVVWDNRRACHSALFDWDTEEKTIK
ncbi:hypothetical protein PACTADRAFT_86430 [Pachysolen tannophilus NRRL Y-2460]|uniref:TauD/TfdA-like domain-containing protein n=1 Tax=Pachysolen tannophilus NRRL Y-2460 TaxID=669874 RepID=A0A1E4TR36_PACTA|nr:hypothetical protein PACTADRAFT_86430 [Pachysolen tannophilus NRRL Y-2460]